MKFHLSQKVILLDTEYKPAGEVVIRKMHDESGKYEVDFVYPGRKEPEQIWVPEERLLLIPGMAQAV